MGKCVLKIYNENEELVEIEDITEKNDIITILEIQGIKCSARSFQIEIEIKQMLVLPQTNLFEKCILVKSKSTAPSFPAIPATSPPRDIPEYLGKPQNNSIIIDTSDIAINDSTNNAETSENILEQEEKDLVLGQQEEIVEIKEDDPNELKEIDLSLDEIPEEEQIQIKNRNDVYYKMYQDAKRKAKMARDLALSAYLEAKQIKNTYMLDDLDDSDSDLDEDFFHK
jgi:hypothetical protein